MNINSGQLVTMVVAGVITAVLLNMVVNPWLESRSGGTATA